MQRYALCLFPFVLELVDPLNHLHWTPNSLSLIFNCCRLDCEVLCIIRACVLSGPVYYPGLCIIRAVNYFGMFGRSAVTGCQPEWGRTYKIIAWARTLIVDASISPADLAILYLFTVLCISSTTSQQPVVDLVMLSPCRGWDNAKLHLPPHRTE